MNWESLATRQMLAIAVATAFTLYLCVCLYWSGKSWYAATRLYGRLPVTISVRMIGWTLRTRNLRRLLAPLFYCALAAPIIWFTDLRPIWLIMLPLVAGVVIVALDLAEPPSILLLGSSQWQTIRLLMRIQLGIHPYRPIVLLDPAAATKARSSWVEYGKFEIDNLRILGPHNWREIVFPLASDVPLIVLDTRLPSPAVVEETHRLLASNLKDKTVFIVNDDGTSPSIDSLGEHVDIANLATAKAETVVDTLRTLGMSRTQSPIDNPWYYVLSSRRIEKRMRRVEMSGFRFTAALRRAYHTHGDTPFVTDAGKLFDRLNNATGAGLAQVTAGLEGDIEATEAFISRWCMEDVPDYQRVVSAARYTCQCLGELQVVLDAAPPNFIKDTLDMLEQRQN